MVRKGMLSNESSFFIVYTTAPANAEPESKSAKSV